MSEAILEHLQQTPVSVKAQLACTALTLEEVMSLKPCDVLLLDKAIDEPVELIVEGRTLFHGQPAKSAGRHAVVITQAHWDAIHNTDPVTGA
jgi:flagellar motor switch protein FliM